MSEINDAWTPKSFDFAQELTKQVMTLNTVLIALTITFVKDFAANASDGARILLAVSWLFYLLSLLLGIIMLMALTGILAEGQRIGIYSASSRFPTTGMDNQILRVVMARQLR